MRGCGGGWRGDVVEEECVRHFDVWVVVDVVVVEMIVFGLLRMWSGMCLLIGFCRYVSLDYD